MKKPNREAGYSLFETLVAFAVMSLVLAAVLPLQSQLITNTKRAEERYLAQELAISLLEEIGVSKPIIEGSETGNYWDWNFEIEARVKQEIETGKIFEITVQTKAHSGTILAEAQKLVFLSHEK